MSNLTKAEIAEVAHAAAQKHLAILIPVLQQITREMDLSGGKEMTDERKDGGPAFPEFDHYTDTVTPGMTLRDWFAGQALAGIAGNQEQIDAFCWSRAHSGVCASGGPAAYMYADALIAERSK